jgi:type II secretory pathway pseudopilin PulG
MRHQRTRRTGFTIVELLVAAALSMVIMLIIGMAFQKMTDTFRTLRSVSQMQERLKSAHMVLKRDLEADHFAGLPNNPAAGGGGTKLSQQRLDQDGWVPTTDGFFCIMQGTNPSNGNLPFIFDNPNDPSGAASDGLPSTRAVTHSLHFTALLKPDPLIATIPHEEDFFYANAPNGAGGTPNLAGQSPVDFWRPSNTVFSSRWAEVMYFLVPNGATANGEPLFALYRRQRLLLDGTTSTPSQAPNTAVPWNAGLEALYPNISWGPNPQSPVGAQPGQGPRVNRTSDIPVIANRMPVINPAIPSPFPQPNGYGNIWRSYNLGQLNAAFTGDDILLTDVLSFEVKVNWTDTQTINGGASEDFENFNKYQGPATNPDWPFAYLPIPNQNNPPRNPQYVSGVSPNFSDSVYPMRTFDTWSTYDGGNVNWNKAVGNQGQGQALGYNFPPGPNLPPLRIRVNSLQIRIRVWDQAGQTARQMTIVEDM